MFKLTLGFFFFVFSPVLTIAEEVQYFQDRELHKANFELYFDEYENFQVSIDRYLDRYGFPDAKFEKIRIGEINTVRGLIKDYVKKIISDVDDEISEHLNKLNWASLNLSAIEKVVPEKIGGDWIKKIDLSELHDFFEIVKIIAKNDNKSSVEYFDALTSSRPFMDAISGELIPGGRLQGEFWKEAWDSIIGVSQGKYECLEFHGVATDTATKFSLKNPESGLVDRIYVKKDRFGKWIATFVRIRFPKL